MPDLRPRRSVLYLPAIRASAIAKARTLDADCVILDLEDAVAPDMKAAARAQAAAAVGAGGWGHREVLIRVNGIDTAWSADDLAAARDAGVDAVVVPKVNSADEAAQAVAMAGGPVWAMIETPRAVVAAVGIAATPGVTGVIAGFADLTNDLRLRPGPDRTPLHYSMGAIVVAARAAGILAFDGVFLGIGDDAGMRAEATQARDFGFDGKTLIHPSQVAIANEVFAPSADEVLEARGLVAAHAAALAAGVGVTTYRGRMVEALHVAAAERLLALSEVLARR